MATMIAPVSDASGGLQFTPDEVEQFQRDGYIIVRGLADERVREQMLFATLEGIGRAIPPVEYEADLQYPGAPRSRESEGGRTIRRLKQAHSRGFVFTEWLSHAPLVRRLQQLLGPQVIAPLAHHNCIMTKQPEFSSDTGWHQDIRYWSFQRPELISVWLALGQERPENGCLWVIPGSHRGSYERDRFDGELFLRPELPENASLIAGKVPAELGPGDTLLFHARTFHAASRNHTRDPKFSVVFTFRPADSPPVAGSRSASSPELVLPSA